MSIVAVTVYRPKKGKKAELLSLLKLHLTVLRRGGYVSRRQSYLMSSENGSIVQVFEWLSKKAKEGAHRDQAWLALWPQFNKLCKNDLMKDLPEAKKPFANFDKI